MSNNELLSAISEMLDTKLDTMLDTKLDTMLDTKLAPIENRLKRIEVDLLENNVLPRLNTIESCYMDTFKRYKDSADQMSALVEDVAMLKKVVAEHSEKLQAIS